MKLYIMGGSPCSGKSTIAEALAETHGLHYFKVDDHLDRYMKLAAQDGKSVCSQVAELSPEQIWMRDPTVQCEEELMIYEEIFEYVLGDLQQLDCEKGIITEGAAYLPELAKQLGVPFRRYLSVTPTKEFQLFHYAKREWVPYALEGCSNQTKAFENWMNRDILFAQAVQQKCKELGYASVVNNGERPAEEMIDLVAGHFGLG